MFKQPLTPEQHSLLEYDPLDFLVDYLVFVKMSDIYQGSFIMDGLQWPLLIFLDQLGMFDSQFFDLSYGLVELFLL